MNFLNYLEDAISLFAIVNPIGNLPIFIQLTSGMKHEKRDRTINIAVLIAFLLLVIFSMSGDFFMARVFKITLNEIKFIGGIVLMVLAVKNLGFDIGGRRGHCSFSSGFSDTCCGSFTCNRTYDS